MKTYLVYGYNYDDDGMSIIIKAGSEEEAREMVEDDFYYGTTYVVELKDTISKEEVE